MAKQDVSDMNIHLLLAKKYKKLVIDQVGKSPTVLGKELWWMKLVKSMTNLLHERHPEIEGDRVKDLVNTTVTSFARDLITDDKIALSGDEHVITELFSGVLSDNRIMDMVELTRQDLLKVNDLKNKKSKTGFGILSCCTAPQQHNKPY